MLSLPFIVNTLSTAAIYALFALATVIAYRTSRILLFAMGEIGMVSAYVFHTVWLAAGTTATGAALAASAVIVVDVALGLVLYAILQDEALEDPFTGTVITIALSITLLGVMAVFWGGSVYQLPLPSTPVMVGDVALSRISLGTILVGGLVALGILFVFYRTAVGIELQALADNRQLAALAGIPVGTRLLAVWIGAALVSGLAGVLSAAVSSVSAEGTVVGFSGMVAAIIGGLTSPAGALAGALLLAVGENAIALHLDVRYSIAVPVGLLVLLLAVRPQGLSARIEHIART
ncbi:branched-chain amino acid ABC transporter permease [Xanthobacter sediminis]|uniref:branched-chain amino acid ABC transporter permease n=1 Tax=Xanthobacter sediminis TaxID=3119926 RepID=UPI0037279635